MPELPEVETIVRDLNKTVLGRKIEDVWSDFKKIIKKSSFEQFKKEIKGKKIQKIWRRGKNIIFNLSGNKILLIHQKLTGHLLFGKWRAKRCVSSSPSLLPAEARKLEIRNWKPLKAGPLQEKVNTYIHLMFWLSGNLMLALSDLRKFAKVELWDSNDFKESKEFKTLGPEPLEKSFTFEKFTKTLRQTQGKLRKGKIKQVLMDQTIIAGVGNIYSDEILWKAKIHPFKDVSKLDENQLKKIYQAIREILPKAIKLGGESFSDFRKLSGEKGYFDKERKVYQREGEKCSRCSTIIKRVKLAGRSAHVCPKCQLLTK